MTPSIQGTGDLCPKIMLLAKPGSYGFHSKSTRPCLTKSDGAGSLVPSIKQKRLRNYPQPLLFFKTLHRRLPDNRLNTFCLKVFICSAEMATTNKASMCRQGTGMRCIQLQVLTLRNNSCFLSGIGSPKHKYDI